MSSHFSWTEKYKRTWEKTDTHQKHHITKTKDIALNTKKALIRHLHISIDHSPNIEKTDFLPSFQVIINDALDTFNLNFVKENPLSIITTSKQYDIFSLQKALDTRLTTHIKEILILVLSLTIFDSNLEETIKNLITANVKVSIICFVGEVRIYKNICKLTGGKYYVPLDKDHFVSILDNFLEPKVLVNSRVRLLPMGFPSGFNKGYCMCHLEYREITKCVKCNASICLGECIICNTFNVDGMSLFKNYYFMNMLKEFENGFGECVCGKEGSKKCPCGTFYCKECDNFLHKTINFCIVCGK